jgi:lipoprotein-anchoring transpeptidase ErfK/SrfK
MSTPEPEVAAVTNPKRLTAVAGALLVTALTLAGAVGIGPGAAPGEATTAGASHAKSQSSGDQTPPSTSHIRSNGWVTVTTAPPGASQDSGSAAPQPTSSGSSADPLALPAHSGSGKRIIYDISAQRVWLVDRKDAVVRTYLVSGGRNRHLLHPGRYAVESKQPQAVSFDGKETMNYMVAFASGKHYPIGFHDIPARSDGTLVESRSQLGTPQSAGCIRQWITDARYLWDFAAVGTPVVVKA